VLVNIDKENERMYPSQGSYRSWKSLENILEIFKALKTLENDHGYGKVWKNP